MPGRDQKEKMDSLMEQLAESMTREQIAKAENERQKFFAESLSQKNRELQKLVKKLMIDKEQKEKDNRVEELETQLKTMKSVERYVVMLGMGKKDAEEAAKHEAAQDMEAWAKAIGRHVKKVRTDAYNRGMQEFLKSRPEINNGNGDAYDTFSATAFEMARRYENDRKLDMGILDQF